MEAVKFLSTWVYWLLFLIPPVCVMAVIYFAIGMMTGEEKFQENKRKIITTLKAAVIIWTIDGFIAIVQTFF